MDLSNLQKKLSDLEKKYSFDSDEIYYFNVHRSMSLVQKLQKRTKEFKSACVPDVFKKSLGEKVIAYEVSQYFGTGHVIVFVTTTQGKKLVLRANHALTTPEYYMDMEKEVIGYYEKVGVKSVQILYSNTSRTDFPFDYQIMLPMTGKDVESEWQGDQQAYDKISFQLGQIAAKQYQLKGTGWGRWKRDINGKIIGARTSHHEYLNAYLDHDLEVLSLFSFAQRKDLEKIVDFFGSKNVTNLFKDTTQAYFVQHDMADHNLRYLESDIVHIYDWENAVIYDPISELGSAPTWKTHFPREEMMIKGFVSELGQKPDNLSSKIAVYFLRTMLWKIAFALKGSRLNKRHLSLFQEAVKRNGLEAKISLEDKLIH